MKPVWEIKIPNDVSQRVARGRCVVEQDGEEKGTEKDIRLSAYTVSGKLIFSENFIYVKKTPRAGSYRHRGAFLYIPLSAFLHQQMYFIEDIGRISRARHLPFRR